MKSCQSPVQPARSRWGQSVGISQALSRNDHSVMSCSRLSRSSLQRNHPVRRRSVWTTTPVTSSGVSRSGVALDARVLEAVGRVARFEHLAGRAGRDHVVDHADLHVVAEEVGRQVVLGDVARRVEELAVHDRQLGAGGTEVAQAQPAVDVLPEVDDLAVGPGPGDGDRAELLHPAGRRRRRVGQVAEVVVDDRDGLPGAGPVPVVLALPRHEVGAAGATRWPTPNRGPS